MKGCKVWKELMVVEPLCAFSISPYNPNIPL